MTHLRAFALGIAVGILVNQRLWVRRIRRTLAADDGPDDEGWQERGGDDDDCLPPADPYLWTLGPGIAGTPGCQCPTFWHGVTPPPCPLHNPHAPTYTGTWTA